MFLGSFSFRESHRKINHFPRTLLFSLKNQDFTQTITADMPEIAFAAELTLTLEQIDVQNWYCHQSKILMLSISEKSSSL